MNQQYAIHHVSMIIADKQKSLDFYCGVLALEQDLNRPTLSLDGIWLNVAGLQIHLLVCANPDAISGRPEHGGHDRHLALSCNNLATLMVQLKNNHIEYSCSKSGRKALFCRDPDGNGLEFVER